MKETFYTKYIKRLLDILFSGIALLVLSPIILLLMLLVRIKHGSPVFFRPARPGKNEKIFRLFKFRTMSNARDAEGVLLPEKDRLTKFGKILRATSLDELPELINIFKGDMSIVGPRPQAKNCLPYYTEEQRLRHEVRPGLTGLAQISGRNNLPWPQRIAVDVEYVKTISFKTDAGIIFKTIKKVITRADVEVPDTAEKLDFVASSMINEEGGAAVKNTNGAPWECGSSFWLDGSAQGEKKQTVAELIPGAADISYTFSGRSAIAAALADIFASGKIKSALVPSYGCLSMLQPFIDAGVKYKFYDVKWQDGKIIYDIPDTSNADVLLIMEYFGIGPRTTDKYIEGFQRRGGIVIEDVTHSLLREDIKESKADYIVGSLRKWFAIPAGGFVAKTAGQLQVKPSVDGNEAAAIAVQAMKSKKEYMDGRQGDKQAFLKKFAAFDNELVQIKETIMIDDLSRERFECQDVEAVKAARRNNAAVLYEGLKDISCISPMFPDFDAERDVPLFVPVMLEEELRNDLRSRLISKNIYCPIHWPEVAGAERGIRANELSLICDQRYDEDDMKMIISSIKEWSGEKCRT